VSSLFVTAEQEATVTTIQLRAREVKKQERHIDLIP